MSLYTNTARNRKEPAMDEKSVSEVLEEVRQVALKDMPPPVQDALLVRIVFMMISS